MSGDRPPWESPEHPSRDGLEHPSWESLERPGPRLVEIDGVAVGPGSLVRLSPKRAGGDVFERALEGRTALVGEVLQDYEGRIQLAVTITDDPGRDLGALRRPGHRFFFDADEVHPVQAPERAQRQATEQAQGPARRVLVAGVGNVFLGDDGWGVALAGRLMDRQLPSGVEVADFGIRGMDLAYAMHDGYETVILLDAVPRGHAPGTLYVIEPEPGGADQESGVAGQEPGATVQEPGATAGAVDAHGMDPVKVLALAAALQEGELPRILIVGCEPRPEAPERPELEESVLAELSPPVQASLDPAVRLVQQLLEEIAGACADRRAIGTSTEGKEPPR